MSDAFDGATRRMQQEWTTMIELGDARATIARLTAERDAMAKERDASWAAVGAWKSLADTLTAERNNAIACRRAADARDGASRNRAARLEEALRRIDAIDFDADSSADAYHAVEVAQQIARQALKDTQ